MKETTKINVDEQNKRNRKKLVQKAYTWYADKARTSIAFDVETSIGRKWFAINTTNLLLENPEFTIKERGYYLDEHRKQREFLKKLLLKEFYKRNYDRTNTELWADMLTIVHFFDPEKAIDDVIEQLTFNYDNVVFDDVEKQRIFSTAEEIVGFYLHNIVIHLVRVEADIVEHLYKISLDMAEEKYLQHCLCKYRYQKYGSNTRIRIGVFKKSSSELVKRANAYRWWIDCYDEKWSDDYDFHKNYEVLDGDLSFKSLVFCSYWREMWDYYEKGRKTACRSYLQCLLKDQVYSEAVWRGYTEFFVKELEKYGASTDRALATAEEIISHWQMTRRLNYQALTTSSELRLPMLSHWYLLPDEEEYLYECVKKYRTT